MLHLTAWKRECQTDTPSGEYTRTKRVAKHLQNNFINFITKD